ncbi:zinc finger CCCH domain-containing protein 14 [Phoenix dactylifera]|uniref:Zinc finger CCCH domain-containing protein 14 n=1 Tax=Phoenix dactylifera TaxID=42345 RepID=A0A8B7CY40_PHODC|nr:zinc finger CCCH domain-containing protein 14 [Phoenix dactylifera]
MPERNPRNPMAMEMETLRSFRMDRQSPEVAKLRAAVSRKLFDFLGNYSDDVLAEYVVVLVCNGKNQNQARDDLEAFLGDESAKFVAWLWDYLSEEISISRLPLDSSNLKAEGTSMQDNFFDREQKPSRLLDHQIIDIQLSKDGLYESPNFSTNSTNTNKVSESLQRWHPSDAPSIEVDAERSLAQTHEVHQKFIPTDTNSSGSIKHMLSSLRYESQHQKITKSNSSALPCRPLPMPKTEAVARKSQSTIIEDAESRPLSMKNTSARRLPSKVMEVEEHQNTQPRGSVWDRLGKPCEEGDLLREKTNCHGEEPQNIRAIEPDATLSSALTGRLAALDEVCDRTISSHHSDRYGKQERNSHTLVTPDHGDKSKRKRQYGQIDSGNGSASFSGCKENHLQDKEAFPKLQRSLPVKHNGLQSLNESTTEAKGSTMMFSEPACHSAESSRLEPHLEFNTVSQSQLDKRALVTTPMQNLVPANNPAPTQSESPSNAHGNGNSRPMENEMLNVKLKLRQVEMDMVKLRSKQVEMNNGKLNASSGVQNNPEEDIESRTVLVTNVHFAASREALSSYFTKCGAIVKVVMLTDTITAQPKGAAYIVFAGKDSVDKALSLSGTSFFSRILTVMRKADMPPGFLVPAQPAGKHLQPWNPQLPKKSPIQRHCTSSNLQWRRDQSASRENSILATTIGLGSSNVGK